MAGGQERVLRRRIRSVESTKKITRAMELIAGSQMVRAQGRIAGSRPYVEGIGRVLEVAAADSTGESRVIGNPEDPRKILLVVFVGDRGLCGAYNSNVLRTAERLIRAGKAEGREYRLVTVGRKAQGFFRFRSIPVEHSFISMSDRPNFADARAVATEVVGPFLDEDVDLVQLISTRYLSAGVQVVETRQVLPLPPTESSEPAVDDHAAPEATTSGGFYDFEPDSSQVLEVLVPVYAEALLYQSLLEASASEHTARQRAMAAATENAETLITNLRRVMNRARQASITTEIMEIVGGAEALRSAGGYDDSPELPIDNHEEQIA